MIKSSPPEATVITQKIKSRGHWQIIVRPCEFNNLRLEDVSKLAKIIEQTAVSLRGWDFPHIGRERLAPQGDWVRDEINWDGIIESWLFFQSSLFHFLRGYRDDWRDESSFFKKWPGWESGKFLNVHDTIFCGVEIYEFAARLAASVPGTDRIRITISLNALQGRHLYMNSESRRHLHSEWFKSDLKDFQWEEEIERTTLMARPRDFSSKFTTELLKRFNWENPERVVQEIQDELKPR